MMPDDYARPVHETGVWTTCVEQVDVLQPSKCMVKKRKRLFIKQVPVTRYSRTPLRTARSQCTPSQAATRTPVEKLGPGQLPSVGLEEDD